MSRDQLASAIDRYCVPGGRYTIDVLCRYVQQTLDLKDIFEIKSVLISMLHAQELVLTDDFKITKK